MQARTPTPKKSEKSDTLFAPQQSSPSPATPDLKKPNNTGGGGGVLFAPQSSHSPQSAFLTPAQTSVKKPPGILFSPQSLTPITLSKRHEAMTAVLIEDPTMNRSRRDKPQSSHVKHRQKSVFDISILKSKHGRHTPAELKLAHHPKTRPGTTNDSSFSEKSTFSEFSKGTLQTFNDKNFRSTQNMSSFVMSSPRGGSPSPMASPRKKNKRQLAAQRRFRILRHVIVAAAAMKNKDSNTYQLDVNQAYENMPYVTAVLNQTNGPTVAKSNMSTRTAMKVAEKVKSLQEDAANKKQSFDREVLPTLADLNDLPDELRMTFYNIAMDILRQRWLPKILLMFKRKYRREANALAKKTTPPMTVAMLRKQTLFSNWPQDILEDAVRNLHIQTYEKNEYVLHEDEQAGSGIFFLAAGTVNVMKKKSRKSKSIGYENCIVLTTLSPIVCLGEYALLTEEPRMASVRAVTACVCWVMNKKHFASYFEAVPKHLIGNISDMAFQKRNANMKLAYPMTVDLLQAHSLFKPCNTLMCQELILSLIPNALPKNFVVCEADELSQAVYFLRHGKCAVTKVINGEPTHIMTLFPGALIGGDSVLHAAPYGSTVRTLTNCDIWKLTREAFNYAFRHDQHVGERMMAEARLHKQSMLYQQRARYRDFACRIPLLRQTVPKAKLRDVILLFNTKVYKPMELICTHAHFCDKIVILTSGKVRIGEDGGMWEVGEAIGYTCLVPHRWGKLVMTDTVAECLELPMNLYEALLKDLGAYDTIKDLTMCLLFPNAHSDEQRQKAQKMISHLKSPPTFVPSQSDMINLHERGFNVKHVRMETFTKVPRGEDIVKVPRESLVIKEPLPGVGTTEGLPRRLRDGWQRASTSLWLRNRPPAQPLPKI